MKQVHYFFRGIILAGLFMTGSSLAHDFWLEAREFYNKPGDSVEFTIHIGNDLVGDSLPNIPSWFDDFSLYRGEDKKDIEGEMGEDPIGRIETEQAGTYLVGYQSTFTQVEIEPETFRKYLDMEGLDNARQYRQQHNETDLPGREVYRRHAKALIQAGEQFEVDDSMTAIGYELEIMPQQNPYRLKVEDRIDFQVLYQGQPDADILLIGFSEHNPGALQELRTNDRGMASIKLNEPGVWLVKAVKILRIDSDEADWKSHWASLTFQIGRTRSD